MSVYTREYPCPICGDDVEVDIGNNQLRVTCDGCETQLKVEYDGDYDDNGKPVDMTKLYKL